MDSQRFNLTHGGIPNKLLLVALPIIGTQLMLMGYNLVDMFLLGRVSADAVAASGSAGMYMWLSNGFMLVGRMGAEIGVAQRKGRGDREGARIFSQNSLYLAAVLGILFGIACILFPAPLISFLNIQEAEVAEVAVGYLSIIGFGMPPLFLASSIAGTFTGAGNSRTPFTVNAAGLVLNAILDPIFIFSMGMGVKGAAVATVIAQLFAFAISVVWLLRKADRPFRTYLPLEKPSTTHVSQILRWSVPISVESMLFTLFAMIVTRFVAGYGATALTVARVGSQIESLCWLICQGFSSGVTAFVGQNFGADKWQRIHSGLRIAMITLVSWCGIVTVLFLTSGRPLVGLFVPDPLIMDMGKTYLQILALSEIFFAMESVAAGAFRGMGRTLPPSIASIVSNALRIPIVYFLASTSLGLDGIWWGVTLSAVLRGTWIYLWFLKDSRSRPKADARSQRLAATLYPPGQSGRDQIKMSRNISQKQ